MRARAWLVGVLAVGLGPRVWGAGTVKLFPQQTRQTIDGFGTCTWQSVPDQSWFAPLYYDDLGASMLRLDMTPRFKAPYSDFTYNSPWFHSSPALPGPDGNNVRTYTNATDYTRLWAGRRAQIAVMGPNLDANIALFDYGHRSSAGGRLAKIGTDKARGTDAFKLFGTIWSPAPWLKLATGNTIQDNHSWPLPVNGAQFPFIWYDSFAGGKLDTTGIPRAEFNDLSLGGTGPTSALTQFACSTAAYIAGYQRHHGVKFDALSLQNEPCLEVFYNSMLYKTSAEYISAIKVLREEFDRHDELRHIQFVGTEDIIGGESTFLWYWDQQGGRRDKILKFMKDIEADPVASAALPIYAVHGAAQDGLTSATSVPDVWNWVRDGRTTPPNPAVPTNVQGYQDFGKKAWMTENSGEAATWLAYKPGGSFPNNGAWSIALKLHQALTVGEVSAWMYWQLSDGEPVRDETATDPMLRENSPKYVALKHYFKFIRPGMQRIEVASTPMPGMNVSAYYGEGAGVGGGGLLTVVMVNAMPSASVVDVLMPAGLSDGLVQIEAYTSSSGALWQRTEPWAVGGVVSLSVPGYGVSTLVIRRLAVIPEPGWGVGWLGVVGATCVRRRRG